MTTTSSLLVIQQSKVEEITQELIKQVHMKLWKIGPSCIVTFVRNGGIVKQNASRLLDILIGWKLGRKGAQETTSNLERETCL